MSTERNMKPPGIPDKHKPAAARPVQVPATPKTEAVKTPPAPPAGNPPAK